MIRKYLLIKLEKKRRNKERKMLSMLHNITHNSEIQRNARMLSIKIINLMSFESDSYIHTLFSRQIPNIEIRG